MTNKYNSGDAVHFSNNAPIPGYMRHARDAYLPLDQRPPPVTLWPYIIATIIAMGCVIFVTAYLWRA